MQLGHIELFVRDPLAAKEFYVGILGFELVDEQQGTFIWVASGGLSILLRPGAQREAVGAYGEAESGLVLYTDDLERTAALLRARGLAFRGTDGSPRCLTFTDPDCHWFQLVNPRDH